MPGPGRTPRFHGLLALLGLRTETVDPRDLAAPPPGLLRPNDPYPDLPLRYRPPSRAPPPPAGPAAAGPAPAPAARRPSSATVGADCPSCHLPTLASPIAGRFSCPLCGRHFDGRTGPAAALGATPPPVRAVPRRSEELLAAWLSGANVSCPKCKAPMRHCGPGEFACRLCGERRAVTGVPGALTAKPAAAPAAPAAPALPLRPEASEQRAVGDRVSHLLDLGGEGTVPLEGGHPAPERAQGRLGPLPAGLGPAKF